MKTMNDTPAPRDDAKTFVILSAADVEGAGSQINSQ